MSGITLLIEDPQWRVHRGLAARLTRAADAARRSSRLKGGFTILLANDKALRALNRDFRGKDKPTNVLSFPGDSLGGRADGRFASAVAPRYAGDIAIAYGVTVPGRPRPPPRAWPIMPPTWWCMACCTWPVMITNGQRMRR